MNCSVYIHTNIINNKKYVGITSQKVEYRWNNGKGYLASNGQTKFANAIQKYGWNNFEHEIIATNLTFEQAKQMEIELIKKYDTFKNGYNMTLGGDGKIGYKLSEETKQKLSESHKGKKNNFHKHSLETKMKLSKPIIQMDLQGNVIAKFYGCNNAEDITGINHSHISQVCKGIRKTAGGYLWQYYEK